MNALLYIPLLLCWGSWLNTVAYRLIKGPSLLGTRSCCPHCRKAIAWYDLVPVISWFILCGRCRWCSRPISSLYPTIELITLLACYPLLIRLPIPYALSYLLFFSALIVTIRTDLEYMLISRYVSLFLVPVGFGLSCLHLLPITPIASLLGSVTGYALLYAVARGFYLFTGRRGMGQGDLELLAFIGAFTGVFGWWFALMIGSLFGSIIGITAMLMLGRRTLKIPFGPFLAVGSMAFVLFGTQLQRFFF